MMKSKNRMSFNLDSEQRWLENVRRVCSPNCDMRLSAGAIELLIIHGISLPPGQYGGPYIDQLFTNTLNSKDHPYFAGLVELRVSSHLLIDRAGKLTQYVPFDRRAWHAGKSVFQGRTACNDFSIGIELEGCDTQPYESVQYKTLAQTVKALQKSWPILQKDRIVGHSDVAAGRKTDPGPAFDWTHFFSLIE